MVKAKITVLGSFVVDLTGRAPHLPVTGETVKGSTFKMGPGGKGSNQGVAAQRAGADVTMITKVGKDTFGKLALDNFENENMDTRFIFIDESHETGAALIMVDENTSDNKILVLSGACEHITDEDVESARQNIENADVFLTQLETNMDSIVKAIDIAHTKGVTTVLNPAPVQPVSDDLLKKVDIIIPNEVEASILTGVKIETDDDVRKAAGVFLSKGIKKVVITLGSKGVYACTEEAGKFVPPIPVKAIDTTGAGDAFSGGFVTAIAEGKDFFEAVKFGNVVGALSVTKLGTAPSMPYRNEIDNIFSTRGQSK